MNLERELAVLLNWPKPLRSEPLKVEVARALKYTEHVPEQPVAVLDASEGPLVFFTGVDVQVVGVGQVGLICSAFAGSGGELSVAIVPEDGGIVLGGDTVLAATCAIALARLSDGNIEDASDILSSPLNADESASSLLETLRCRHSRSTLEEAVQAVMATIQERQSRHHNHNGGKPVQG